MYFRHDDKIKVFLKRSVFTSSSTLEVQSVGDFLVNMEPYWLQLIFFNLLIKLVILVAEGSVKNLVTYVLAI